MKQYQSTILCMEDPHLKERDFLQEVEHPELGKWRHMGVPWHFSATPAQIRHRSPLWGEHNHYVFEELLGMSPEEIKELEEKEIAF